MLPSLVFVAEIPEKLREQPVQGCEVLSFPDPAKDLNALAVGFQSLVGTAQREERQSSNPADDAEERRISRFVPFLLVNQGIQRLQTLGRLFLRVSSDREVEAGHDPK